MFPGTAATGTLLELPDCEPGFVTGQEEEEEKEEKEEEEEEVGGQE